MRSSGSPARMNLFERREDYLLLLDLPGVAAGDVELDIDHGVLSLSTRGGASARLRPAPPEHGRLFEVGEWQVRLDFGNLLLGDNLRAVQEDGVLLITLPKAEPSEPTRRIQATER